ncbi:glycine--tRNA ligase subunit beta [Siccirubricoccus sp. G192]|uniref:glycine--tRNA ligase subunit beta n=1 Tax=Siccirubricoccus sp. G192 TaxID=2849651 RepID=UPI001C2C03E1|nr:glycine--tRNA ligase subunit beta [Siccirubricoccus sp. G192]MBV1796773.1 glycine--tRNA ligase subunit beta [Siccirubricoccus sp. G192]
MPELLLELFSEEIPARMQARAAEDLARLLHAQLAALMPQPPRAFHGPRRLTLVGQMERRAETPGREERGPRLGAPAQAIEGFLRKHGATRDALTEAGQFWVLARPGEVIEARDLLARAVPAVLRGFPWPKSMRWGTSGFTWVRPLQRILCVFDGEKVPFTLAQEGDAAHGLVASDVTEGHRIMAGTEPFAVRSFAEYEAGLRARHVVLDAEERARLIRDGIAGLAAREGLEVVADAGLVAEVAGLVEWPVPLLGRIDGAFMDLPVEVMRTTMRVNQRYFTLRHEDGSAAPCFALVSNIAPSDGGAAVVGGNERVLRARLSDARFFWDQDRKQKLVDFLPKLESVVFHAKLGTQGERVRRLERLSELIAPMVGADPVLAARAARLAKADLASGMVGEFPELQGVMGRYYALHDGEDARVAEAVGAHYRPLGPTDAVPREPVAIAVALADKLDQLAGFFAVGEKPTGSGDPFALRRAALGVIRIVRENGLRIGLAGVVEPAAEASLDDHVQFTAPGRHAAVTDEAARPGLNLGGVAAQEATLLPLPGVVAREVLDFLTERLRVQLRAEGARHDLVAAVFGAAPDDDLVRLLARADALRALVESPDGVNLLAAYRRAANILRIEDRKDGPHTGPADPALLRAPEEIALAEALAAAEPAARARLAAEDFAGAMAALAGLRVPVDAFFDRVTVNDPDLELRRNRLALLAGLRAAMDSVADLSKIEG